MSITKSLLLLKSPDYTEKRQKFRGNRVRMKEACCV